MKSPADLRDIAPAHFDQWQHGAIHPVTPHTPKGAHFGKCGFQGTVDTEVRVGRPTDCSAA